MTEQECPQCGAVDWSNWYLNLKSAEMLGDLVGLWTVRYFAPCPADHGLPSFYHDFYVCPQCGLVVS
jgi:hypothetical protein